MNKTQWGVLGIASILFGMLFSVMSLQAKRYCDMFGGVDMGNILACVRGESFAPYPYIFMGLGIVFFILSWIEQK